MRQDPAATCHGHRCKPWMEEGRGGASGSGRRALRTTAARRVWRRGGEAAARPDPATMRPRPPLLAVAASPSRHPVAACGWRGDKAARSKVEGTGGSSGDMDGGERGVGVEESGRKQDRKGG
ncbi:hypothetical protein PR202_ga09997 [Eleusine coracana subsp. coracana]|uniref:Uncharacterized protein n=1 Tax=Eleusine coracana subsp. coracana TaxID=191504 RepID=A0AAV5C5F4_ELECO|nr:hypothetical protein PR202_ga09997 [Eleusine coracana subsp. coracana]